MLNKYLKNLLKVNSSGDATEESYYHSLASLFESFFEVKKMKKGEITILPKKKVGNKPDFVVRIGKELIGYIEAKDFSKVENLQGVEETEQIERYKKDFDNFILTNFVDFWLWRKSENKWVKRVRIQQPNNIVRLKTLTPIENEEQCLNLVADFIGFSVPERKTSKQLALELASRAKRMKEPLLDELTNEIDSDVDKIYRAFQRYLLPDLKVEDFADIYAQTVAYGLFIARLQYKGERKNFDRTVARDLIPKNLKILRDTFAFVSRRDLTNNIDYIIDDIATVLAYCDIEKIKGELHREKGKDPIVHFYETFLIEYDPAKRKKMGEYYTPLPVVHFIVSSVNQLLKEKFNKRLGFASEGVTFLDFASGTCTFPAEAIVETKEEIDNSSNSGSWLSIIKGHILNNFYGFEISMASWIIGHLKIALLLEDLGYKMGNGDRFKLFLTNTLDFTKIEGQDEIFTSGLSEEAIEAGIVKKEKPILVILGNPPYSVSSSNIIKVGSELYNLYESYKEVVRKEEKNIQPLSDDYIKFIAFAHYKINQSGKGIVGIITNNSYLDGLIHRDIRRRLLEDFDEIYILNLHGNSKRNEKTPEGSKDENVFNIQRGVAILLLVKGSEDKGNICYSDLWGLRNEKYNFLENNNFRGTKNEILKPKAPNYFFVPKDFKQEEKYNTFISIKNIFGKYNAGIATGKDEVLTGFDQQNIKTNLSIDNEQIFKLNLQNYGINSKLINNWYNELKEINIDEQIKDYNYRIFDKRYIIYNVKILQRARDSLMRNLLVDNIALVSTKILSSSSYCHVFVSDCLSDRCYISNRGREANYFFPLYLYKEQKVKPLFNGQRPLDLSGVQHKLDNQKENKISNIKKEILEKLKVSYKTIVKPEEIFNYIYAVLYSNKYRAKYQEFLKIDFPRVPFTVDYKLFKKLGALGLELIESHLLKSKNLQKSIARFIGQGLNEVKKREYNKKEKRLYINNKQYFENIEPEVWEYYIGGYQVLDKWIKDRIGSSLKREEVEHYLKVITSLNKTLELQKKIDELYPQVEKSLIK